MKFNWKKAVANIAPVLGTAIGGPFGGMAAKVVTDALGLPETSSDKEIEKALQASPEALVKLKKAELSFKTKLKELEIDKEELAFKDRNSARKREMALKDNAPKLLAFTVTMGFFGLLAIIVFYPIPEGAKDILQIMIGSLGAAWLSIVTYYFGSSDSSSKKNDIIERKLNGN